MIAEALGAAWVFGHKIGDACAGRYHLRRFRHAGRGIAIGRHFAAYAPQCIAVEDGVSIAHDVTLRAITGYPWTSPAQRFEPQIVLGRECFVNSYTQIAAVRKVVIGAKVMIAQSCFIADYQHGYRDVSRSVREQPLEVEGEVHIGEGSWIGAGSCVMGNVVLGRNCVIGAGSVVTRSLPDFCVAVGAPLRVVKRYDPDRQRWCATTPAGEFA